MTTPHRKSFSVIWIIGALLSCVVLPCASAQSCGSQGVAVQVLGSGGPELQDKRASSSYLVWQNGINHLCVPEEARDRVRVTRTACGLGVLP